MNFNVGLLNKISFIYLSISLLIFIVGWFNPLFITISLTALCFILRSILKDKTFNNSHFYLEKDYIFIIFIIGAVWVYFSGIGGFFQQCIYSSDWHARNALIHDLIAFPYPTIYDNNAAIAYYIGFFLLPAVFGKAFFLITQNLNLAIIINNIALYIWSCIGIFLIFLQIIVYTNANKLKSITAVIIFVLFSGMDILCFSRPHHFCCYPDWHWYSYSLYLSNSINLFNVFHISIPLWLLFLLFLQYKDFLQHYGILLLLVLFYYPSSMISFCFFMIPMTVYLCLKNKNNLKKIFDLKNILSIFILCPLFVLFYKTNYTAIHNTFFINHFPIVFFKDFFFEVGIYLLLILFAFKRDLLYYCTLFSLILIPFIAFYNPFDISIKTTIPALLMLCLLIIKYLVNNTNKIIKYILSIALLIGTLTPLLTVTQELVILKQNPYGMIKNDLKTFNNKIDENIEWYTHLDTRNYGAINYKQFPFWKYIAKKDRLYDRFK